MLETLDLSVRMSRGEFRRTMERVDAELPILQRAIREQRIPVLVTFDGWIASGRGDSIGQLVHRLDPRGARVDVTHASSLEEQLRPWPWRFARRLPPRGSIGVFDRSWYYLLASQREEGTLDAAAWERELAAVNEFERQQVDDGMVLIKFWLHVSQAEQKRRLKAWAKDATQRWRVSDEDWKRLKRYKSHLALVEEMIARTHTHLCPWTLVEAEDENVRRARVLATMVDTLRRELAARGVHVPTPEELPDEPAAPGTLAPLAAEDPLGVPPPIPPDSPLARVDLSLKLDRGDYDKRVKRAQGRLRELEFLCFERRLPVVIVFEGQDAAGKGGAIRRLTEKLDPRGYAVIPIQAPTRAEKDHQYLWRFWSEVPKDGHWGIFDRSWYGRVLVERVEGFCSETEWRRAFQEINEFERALSNHGTVVVKFWLQIGPEEQMKRFRRREQTPARRYKITDEDWRNRGKYPQYLEAVSEMLRQTSTPAAPWTIVEAEDKLWARVKVLETVVRAIEART